MKKEIIIIFFIVITIIVAHAITQIYTQNFFDSVCEDLSNIENKLFSESPDSQELKNDINKIQDKWNKKYDYFACYVEHDELEKVKTQLISIEANIKVGDCDKAIDEAERCIFILKHIEEKDSLKIVNIF